MSTIFAFLYKPLFNFTVLLYNILPGHDFGLAIIVLTVIVRVLFFPLSVKAIKSQRALSKISPKLREIKEKYKNNQAAQSAATMQLYKDNKVNPFAGCLPLLIQIPILIALYQVFATGFKPESLSLLYGFIENPEAINKISLGFIDITTKNHFLTLLAGGLQYLQSLKSNQSQVTSPDNKEMATLNKQMLYFFPIFIIIIGWNLPAGVVLYWVVTTAFATLEQIYVQHKVKDE